MPVEWLLLLVCLAGQAFFSGMETGVISVHRLRLRHAVRQGRRKALILETFLENPDRMFGTTLTGTNLCMVVLSVTAVSLGGRYFGAVGRPIATTVITLVVLVFGEYLPKTWFRARPLERAQRFAGVLRAAAWFFWPVAQTIVLLSRVLVPGTRRSFAAPAPFVSREDLKILAHEGEKEGVLSSRERFMISRVIELESKQARQIMTPLARVIHVPHTATIETFLETARQSRFTRLPVVDETTGRFVGVVNVFVVLAAGQRSDRRHRIGAFARPPLFIEASMPADDILPYLRRSRQPLGLVRDAAGEVMGLITTEDILREIVGAV